MKWKTFSLEEKCLKSDEHTKIRSTLATSISRMFFEIVYMKTAVYMCPVKYGEAFSVKKLINFG